MLSVEAITVTSKTEFTIKSFYKKSPTSHSYLIKQKDPIPFQEKQAENKKSLLKNHFYIIMK